MSIEDEIRAQRALAHYLIEWGVNDAATKAQKYINELTAQGWQMSPDRESRPRPPRAGEACQVCQRHVDRCICAEGATDRPTVRARANSAWQEARRQLATHPDPTEGESR